MTSLGASIVVPEAVGAMVAILPQFVEINDLQRKASAVIARLTGGEAGFVTASCSAGISLAVAGAITGSDLLAIERLPDAVPSKNEVLVQMGHVVSYGAPVDQAIRLGGGRPVLIGQATSTHRYHMEQAINEKTAAAVYVISHHVVNYGLLHLTEFVEIAHAKGVPVIVDAASEYDLKLFLSQGADIALYSGHKFLGGPTSGIVAGRKELVRNAFLQNMGIGRGMKVGKESIFGAMAALEAWERRDHTAVRDRETGYLNLWKDRLDGRPGIIALIEPDPTNNPLDRLRVIVSPADAHITAWDLAAALRNGSPPIIVRDHEVEHHYFYLDPCNLHPGQETVVADRLVEELEKARFSNEIIATPIEDLSRHRVTSLSIMRLLQAATSRIQGSIMLGSRDLLSLSESEMRKVRGNEIAMIFQEPMTSLNPLFTIGDQISEALLCHHTMSAAEARSETVRLLEKVRIPSAASRFDEYPHRFSGGMRQRVMIAMALASKPRLLIADEPTTALDVTIQGQILDLIKTLQDEEGTSVLFITHDMGVVAEIADRTIVMYRGEQVEAGATTDIFHRGQHPYTRALLSAVPVLGSMQPYKRPLRFPVVDNATGLSDTPIEVTDTVQPDNPVLAVKNLTKRFDIHSGLFGKLSGRVHAVENVSFDLYAGETLSLVGESGCGKSTTGRAIMRLIEPDSGSVAVEGRETLSLDKRAIRGMRTSMQMIFQDPFASLNPRMTVAQAIAEPYLEHKMGTAKEARDLVADLLLKVGLSPAMGSRYPHEFSGGQRQRICIARALTLQPKIIIADESVSALDVSIKAQVINLMLDLQQSLGLAFLFISHDMAVVERVSHRVAVMYLGEIVEIGPRASVFGNPQHPYTKKLMAAVPAISIWPEPFRGSAPISGRGEILLGNPTGYKVAACEAGGIRMAGEPDIAARFDFHVGQCILNACDHRDALVVGQFAEVFPVRLNKGPNPARRILEHPDDRRQRGFVPENDQVIRLGTRAATRADDADRSPDRIPVHPFGGWTAGMVEDIEIEPGLPEGDRRIAGSMQRILTLRPDRAARCRNTGPAGRSSSARNKQPEVIVIGAEAFRIVAFKPHTGEAR
eukprot:g18136.t1